MMTTAQEFERRRWIALALLCFAQFIVVLDASIVNVALPSIGEGLDFSQENLPWVVNAYVLTFGGFLLLGGRMADLLGRRRVFIGGLLLVAAASLAAGFASTEGQLIAARAAQGLGAAIISRRRCRSSPRPSATARSATRRSAPGGQSPGGGAAGVLFGGILTDGLGWEWVLWINVPVALVVAALAPRLIAESRSESATPLRRRRRGHRHRRPLAPRLRDRRRHRCRLGLAADPGPARIVGGADRRLRDDRAPVPGSLMPFRIFRIRTLTGANAVGLLVGGSLFSMFFFITLYMQQVLGFSAIEAGLAYLPLALMIIVASGIASQLVTRIGFKPVLAAGMALIAAALIWFSQVSVGGGFVSDILGPSLLAATGLGFAFVTTTIAAVSGVRDQESGLASGLINTSQQIGGALGLAVLATVANSRTDDLMASSGATRRR